MKRVLIALAQVLLLVSCNGNSQNAAKHSASPIATRTDNTVAIQILKRNNGYNLIVRNLDKSARIFVNNKSYQVIDTSGVYPLASNQLNPGENKIMLVTIRTKGADTCVSSIFLPYESTIPFFKDILTIEPILRRDYLLIIILFMNQQGSKAGLK